MLRMFRLLFKSSYRRVRKMQLHLVLFALFIYTIFKDDNAPVICIHGTTYGDSRGKVLDNYFLIVPAVPGKCGGITLGHLPCWEFLLCRVGQSCYHQLFPTGRGLYQGSGK